MKQGREKRVSEKEAIFDRLSHVGESFEKQWAASQRRYWTGE